MGSDGSAGLVIRVRRQLRDRFAVVHCRAFFSGDGSRLQSRGGSVVGGVAIYLAYIAGLTLIVGVLAVGAATASSALADRLRRALPFVNRISGVLLLVVGLYVGYYGLYEVRLFTASKRIRRTR